MLQGMVLYFRYGTIAGGVFALVLPFVGFETVTLATAVGLGLGYSVVLFIGAAVFWMNLVLGLDPEPKQVGFFLQFHLIYGGVLGAIIGAGLI